MDITKISASDLCSSSKLKQPHIINESNDPTGVTQQFEVFLQSTLKSTRIEQHFRPPVGINHKSSECLSDIQNASKFVEGSSIDINTLIAPNTTSKMPVTATNPLSQQPIIPANHSIDKHEPIISPSIDDFVKSVWPFAKQAAHNIGLDPKILLAQAALETGWGQYIAHDTLGNTSNNLFNIKASTENTNQSVSIKTTEFIADTPIKIEALFKKYSSIEHSLNDYVSLIKNSNRYKTALANADDPKRYMDALQHAGYATDPNYANKIYSIYQGKEIERVLERNGLC
jgi:flagellar protein FlgJ